MRLEDVTDAFSLSFSARIHIQRAISLTRVFKMLFQGSLLFLHFTQQFVKNTLLDAYLGVQLQDLCTGNWDNVLLSPTLLNRAVRA